MTAPQTVDKLKFAWVFLCLYNLDVDFCSKAPAPINFVIIFR